jgi:hypothetical protein
METSSGSFVDRRNYDVSATPPAFERRQFTNSHDDLSPDARELALAIDGYKMRHRRRFVDFEEMLAVIKSLGYRK